MALTATVSWCWYLDREHNLCIELDDKLCFQTPYRRNALVPRVIRKQRLQFETEEAAFYTQLCESLHDQCPHWSDAEVTQVALNATATQFLVRMPANRSWLFAVNPQQDSSPWQPGDLANLQGSCDQAMVVILSHEGQAASCLLLEPMELAESARPLTRFSPQRINCDRFFLLPSQTVQPIRQAG